jgi:hypothetical protein
MKDWVPVLVLPNIDMRDAIGCEHAAIVSVTDERVEKLRAQHPKLTTFLSKFSTQFGQQVLPAVLLLAQNAPKSYFTAEAVTAFRDVLSMAVVPYARASRLYYDRSSELAFTNAFQFYPWMIDAKYDELLLTNPAQMHVHLLEEFSGQTFPEQPQVSISDVHVDRPLVGELLARWLARYNGSNAEWHDKALFRSLSMANQAAAIPALTAATFYDVGRSLALWVSAYEILAHPGGSGLSNFGTVADLLDKVTWLYADLAKPEHVINSKTGEKRSLAVWICRRLYELRNDYLHGNEVDAGKLELNGKVVIDFAACIFRMVLTGFLDLRFCAPKTDESDKEAVRKYLGLQLRFNTRQELFERALMRAK